MMQDDVIIPKLDDRVVESDVSRDHSLQQLLRRDERAVGQKKGVQLSTESENDQRGEEKTIRRDERVEERSNQEWKRVKMREKRE